MPLEKLKSLHFSTILPPAEYTRLIETTSDHTLRITSHTLEQAQKWFDASTPYMMENLQKIAQNPNHTQALAQLENNWEQLEIIATKIGKILPIEVITVYNQLRSQLNSHN